MHSRAGDLFRQCVRSVAGLDPKGKLADSLMTSLPSELIFNDMRDTARRAKKSEKTMPGNLHTVASRSVVNRSKGCTTMDLSSSDWCSPLPHGGKACAIKASVSSALRSTDKELGVNTHGLTRQKHSQALTKPHVFTARLRMFNGLCDLWHSYQGSAEQKAEKIHGLTKSLWMCKLVPTQAFIRIADPEGMDDLVRFFVISAGPHSVQVVKMKWSDDHKCFRLASKRFCEGCSCIFFEKLDLIQAWPVLDQSKYGVLFRVMNVLGSSVFLAPLCDNVIALVSPKVALVQATISLDEIGWNQEGDFMSICEYIASYSICTLPCNLLSSVLRSMQWKGHSKLDHRLKAEFFLRKMGRNDDQIQDILANLVIRTRKKKKQEGQEGEEQNGEEEQAEQEAQHIYEHIQWFIVWGFLVGASWILL